MIKTITTFIFGLMIILIRIAITKNPNDMVILIINTVINVLILYYSIISIGISSWKPLKEKYKNNDFLEKILNRIRSILLFFTLIYLIVGAIYLLFVWCGIYKDSTINDIICIAALCISIESQFFSDKLVEHF